MNLRSIAFAISLAALAPLGQAIASDTGDRYSKVVTFGDLNTATSAGAEQLYQRIERAARVVCRDRPGARPLSYRRLARACRADTVAKAIDDLDLPLVTAVHLQRTGEAPRRFAWFAGGR